MFDLAALRAGHARFLRRQETMAHAVLRREAPRAKKYVAAFPGFTHRTRGTLNATRARVIRTRRGGKIIISNSDRKAHWLEHGTRPHVIRARKVRFLKFFWKRLGRVVFFKQVNHPGTKPYQFLRRATEHVGDRVESGLRRGMTRVARSF